MTGKSKIETLNNLLEDLGVTDEDIEAAVVSVDGFVIASALPHEAAKERVAIMSSAMHSLGETAVRELTRGTLSEVYVKGENGYVVVMSSGKNAVLTTIARKEAELKSVFSDMRRTAAEVAKLV
ncbi:MAG: roadblock/LC7 domain-containing protein [Theionarchaea archaeon]|nr:roadblock/LC7 domain-containing protein [Theionarchaea archaeon]